MSAPAPYSRRAANLITSLLLLFVVNVISSPAQGSDLPLSIQVALISKIISFDRSGRAAKEPTFHIAVIYQRKLPSSLRILSTLQQLAPVPTIGGKPVRFTGIDLDAGTDPFSQVETASPHAVYVTAMRGVDIDRITAITRKLRLLSFTGVAEYTESGISIGLVELGDKPQIIINLEATRAEGADLSARLLAIAKVL